MATTTDAPAGVQMIALQEIRTDRNVRQQLVAEEVDALAQSIKLLGQLTPVSVRPAEDGGYVLIAGHKRCAALASLARPRSAPSCAPTTARRSQSVPPRTSSGRRSTPTNRAELRWMHHSAGFGGAVARADGRSRRSGLPWVTLRIVLHSDGFRGPVRIRCNIVAVSSALLLTGG
jgi:hypothetical protein